ncbi:MAG: hypothetical protein ACRCZ9_02975 [Fusobacteriaceae bacterium]
MKKHLIKSIALIFSTFLLIILFNYTIDPYQYFRKPKFYKLVNLNSRYLNSGLIKHQEYDTIILGTSMTENISTNEVKDIFGYKAIKLSVPAGRLPDVKRNLTFVNENKDIKNIIYGLDIYTFNEEKNYMRASVPDFLYKNLNKNIILDYLLNAIGLQDSLKVIIKNIIGDTKTLDNLYSWYEEKNGLDNSKEVIKDYQNKIQNSKTNSNTSEEIFEQMKLNYNYNLKPLLEKNKDKNIIIYFAPYSILCYKLWEKEGYLSAYSDFEKYLCEEFFKYPNINIYYFKNDKSITHDLNNFYDIQHHTEKINSKILKKINIESDKLTQDNYRNFIEEWYIQTINYKY